MIPFNHSSFEVHPENHRRTPQILVAEGEGGPVVELRVPQRLRAYAETLPLQLSQHHLHSQFISGHFEFYLSEEVPFTRDRMTLVSYSVTSALLDASYAAVFNFSERMLSRMALTRLGKKLARARSTFRLCQAIIGKYFLPRPL